MENLTLKKISFDKTILKRKFAEENDCDNLITSYFKLIDQDTGEPVALCCPIDDKSNLEQLKTSVHNIKNWSISSRGSGLKTTAKVFGYQPRNPIRQRPFCHKGVLSREQPIIHSNICNFATTAQNIFQKHLPIQFQNQLNLIENKVKINWRLNNSIYTSGIINNNNSLAYHRDRGNFEDFWSAMVLLKKDIEGGNLIIKDYNLKVNLPNDSIFFFNGMRWWHGVTPIKKIHKNGYRYTVVYYSLKEIWKCMSIEDELAHAIKKRQEIELKRIKK